MKVAELMNIKEFTLVTKDADLDKDMGKPFCCDLLSIAMSKMPQGAVWVNVMGNINTLAVASLNDASCIILAENIQMDEAGIKKANAEGIILFTTELPIYDAARKVDELLA